MKVSPKAVLGTLLLIFLTFVTLSARTLTIKDNAQAVSESSSVSSIISPSQKEKKESISTSGVKEKIKPVAAMVGAVESSNGEVQVTKPVAQSPAVQPEKQDLAPRQIFKKYPDVAKTDPMALLGRLAVTHFDAVGTPTLTGADDQFQTYDFQTQNNEAVTQWHWTGDNSVAVEQINLSPSEKIIRRYYDHTGVMSEVSYEYNQRGGLFRFRDDGSVESYQTWGGHSPETVIRYDQSGNPNEVWHMDSSGEWIQD